MTTLFLSDKKCFICGTTSKYPLVDLTLKISGSRDLDGRPSHIQRSLVYLWIQRCTTCNYCAPEIAKGEPEDSELIKNPEYIQFLSDENYPETARSFRAYSYIMNHMNLFADAGWAQLCAAWVCDDNAFKIGSDECRKNAFDLFTNAQKNKQEFSQTRAEEAVYLIDILRRISQFDKALAMCNNELENDHPDHILDLLDFEKELIENKDIACHDENEAEEYD